METIKEDYLIRIIDDDKGMLKGLQFLLKCKGWNSKCYASAIEFLQSDDYHIPGCLLLDIRMPGMSGMELQLELIKRDINLPVIIMTGHADVETAVWTLKTGALDFLQKPVKADQLDEALQNALSKVITRDLGLSANEAIQIWKTLTDREKEVVRLASKGLTSKVIGERLGLSERTIQGHRLNLSKKFGIHTKKELIACVKVIEDQNVI